MSTTITPSLGHGALMTQQGVGTSPGFDSIDVRRMSNGDLQEGVLNASDFMVVQRAAGANLSVDIGMPAGGYAYVQGDTVSGQGLYTVPVHSATVNETITAANATNPRIDQIILEVLDNVHDASGSNLARTRVLTGTATSGATLDNRTGAAILPGSALLLADVLVGATATTIDNTKIRDRRKWARGALWRTVDTVGNYTISATTFTEVDTTNLKPRIECSGAPIMVTAQCRMDTGAATNAVMSITPMVDGAVPSEAGTGEAQAFTVSTVASGGTLGGTYSWLVVPSAGSHRVSLAARRATANGTLYASASVPLIFSVQEIARQNTANNTTTTG